MSIDMQQFHSVFFEETQEHIHEMERILLGMDVEALDAEDINRIFRAAHSIKGGSAIFGFDGLTGLTHEMESILVLVRNNELSLNKIHTTEFLTTIDLLQTIFNAYQQHESIPDKNIAEQIVKLQELLPKGINSSEDDAGFGFFDLPISSASSTSSTTQTSDDEAFGFFEPLQPTPVKSPSPTPKKASEESAPTATSTSSIRVDTQKIDSLVNLVGELVIADAMLQQLHQTQVHSSENLQQALENVNHNIRLMQDAVMSMRMLPLSFVFNRFPRVVHDIASKLDKQVELVIEGAETEIDKGMIEKIVDPLTHLIRNSVDHGIESAAQRTRLNKPVGATVTLKAYQKGNNIHIDVSDDGAGLDTAKILKKAKENGLTDTADLTDTQIWDLILAPGFSTAEKVTDVSGRGVGMDVVRQNIEQLNGRISIDSQPNEGTTFSLSLPLTMAIVEGMKICCAEQTYIIPLTNIIESLRPTQEQLPSVANHPIIHIRDEYLPLISLHDLMAPNALKPHPTQSIIMIIESGKHKFCLHVDSLEGQQQVVIKSLEKNYKAVTGVSAATIMGDGSVAMILDVEQLAHIAKQQQIADNQHG